MNQGSYLPSQKGHPKLIYQDYIYNRSVQTKKGRRWNCERRDIQCYAYIIADAEGRILQTPKQHNHRPDKQRQDKLRLKRALVERTLDRLEEPPEQTIAALVTPDKAQSLPTEINLKQSLRYFRRKRHSIVKSCDRSKIEGEKHISDPSSDNPDEPDQCGCHLFESGDRHPQLTLEHYYPAEWLSDTKSEPMYMIDLESNTTLNHMFVPSSSNSTPLPQSQPSPQQFHANTQPHLLPRNPNTQVPVLDEHGEIVLSSLLSQFNNLY